ncbi:MAG: fatty acid desaturase [Spirochaetales bacterium]|nr:fatty acid desaturase [Spirochaetales bacterium]MCF7938940.1 fatty acid desaturase [Spirochaetales bacterium]
MSDTVDFGDVLERWYRVDIPRNDLSRLAGRSDAKGLVRLIGHFGILAGFGIAAYLALGTWLMFPAFFLYGTVYCFLNHLMHETHHRTPFKSVWINEVFHWISSFAHGAEPVFDRWAHTQHHTYTYMEEKDPEIVTTSPINRWKVISSYFGFGFFTPLAIFKRALGVVDKEVEEYVPQSDWKKMRWSSWFWLLGYAAIIGSCFYFGTILPLVYTVFARCYGALIPSLLNNTQHIGLEFNVYDHRLCTRDVYINPILSFFYWNMQYHTEHHMYPSIPFHALKKMHRQVKDRLPPVYPSLWAVNREIRETMRRQKTDPHYRVTPQLPQTAEGTGTEEKASDRPPPESERTGSKTDASDSSPTLAETPLPKPQNGWYPACRTNELEENGVLPFKNEGSQYAVYRLADGFYATSGKCTHAGALLSKGLIFDGEIECPAHQGRFSVKDGCATRSPAHSCLEVVPVTVEDEVVWLQLS